jgi:pimeloyl-ACP methyl ester carboxylesterase
MSTDAWLQERPISKTILPRLRRTPELPPLPIPHVPTRSRRYTALSAHAPNSRRARYSGSHLNGRLRARECRGEQARNLTEPSVRTGTPSRAISGTSGILSGAFLTRLSRPPRDRSTIPTGQKSPCTLTRVRWGLAPPDPAYDEDERRIATSPAIHVPTLVIHGGADPCNEPATSDGKERFFTGPYRREVLPRIGHFPQRTTPEAVGRLVTEFLNSTR